MQDIDMQDIFSRLDSKLKKISQEHLLQFWKELTKEQQQNLSLDIESIDFELMHRLHSQLVQNKAGVNAVGELNVIHSTSLSELSTTQIKELEIDGLMLIAKGQVAAFLVAGGQGSRLGFEGPKGAFRIGLPSGKSLFQLQAERLLNLSQRAGKTIPWYIMTSPENHTATLQHFQEKHFFGYPQSELMFFSQGTLAATDFNGKILLQSKSSIAKGPNGNGGCFLALKESGALADMAKRGVESLFFYSVDNALVRVCDPIFLALFQKNGAEAASKSVAKSNAHEKVGVLCLQDSKPAVVEYSDLPDEWMNKVDNNGKLLLNQGNIAVHLFKTEFLESASNLQLPFHLARKKIAWINDAGDLVQPTQPNACKYEMFMFDLFPMAKNMFVCEVKREEEFAPVKNADGVDSPSSARALIKTLHQSWIQQSGYPEKVSESRFIEISPKLSYAGEGLNKSEFYSKLQNSSGDIAVE